MGTIQGSAGAEQSQPSVNFTFRKKATLPEPAAKLEIPAAHPEQAVHPSTELRVNGESKDTPASPAVRAEPEPVRAEPVEARTEEPPVVPTPSAPVPAPVTEWVPPPEIVWLDGEHGHPSKEGFQFHAVTFAKPWPIRATQMITQQVWLDPQDPPRGIALQFKRADDEEAGVYWEGEQEVFNPAEHQDLWYYGLLPELGQWVTLEILAEDLGLEEAQISGIRFVTIGGRALWDKSSIKEAPPLEEARPEAPSVNSNKDSVGPP